MSGEPRAAGCPAARPQQRSHFRGFSTVGGAFAIGKYIGRNYRQNLTGLGGGRFGVVGGVRFGVILGGKGGPIRRGRGGPIRRG